MSYSSSTSRGGGNSRGGGGRGRGEYYKNKYGGRGGRGSGGDGLTASQPQQQQQQIYIPRGGGTYRELRQLLKSIDGRQYPSYHDLETPEKSGWVNDDGPCGFTLEIGRAQSDPFAPPTRCRVTVPQAAANFPSDFFAVNRVRRMASADYVWRQLYQKCKQMGADQTLRKGGGGWSGPKGGDIQVMEPTQHVMEQSAIWIDAQGNLTCQLTVNLPARGRTVLGSVAAHILDQVLSQLVRDCLQASSLDLNDMRRHVDSIEDQAWLQNQLDNAGLVSFVRNGAILPRASGVDDRPLTNSSGQVIPFQSPLSLQTSFTLPNAGVTLTGMGIPKGITLICGGGFHGKSTLLQALQLAVYYKIPGDGREFCVTSVKAAKIRAEDGRCVNAVDISSFIKNLPFGTDTTCFTTADASGSTSQASNIVESIEMGADALLIDEDTCATNFMIRDNKMMQLVACEKEPITPFVRVVGSLKVQGVSTVLVVGGTGDFFDVADHVLLMDCYRCDDATTRARQIVKSNSPANFVPPSASFGMIRNRYPVANMFSSGGKVKVLARNVVSFGDTEIDLSATEQIISSAQTNAIAHILQRLASSSSATSGTLLESLRVIECSVDADGLDILAPGQYNGSFMRPRILEISAAVNRLRRACIKQR